MSHDLLLPMSQRHPLCCLQIQSSPSQQVRALHSSRCKLFEIFRSTIFTSTKVRTKYFLYYFQGTTTKSDLSTTTKRLNMAPVTSILSPRSKAIKKRRDRLIRNVAYEKGNFGEKKYVWSLILFNLEVSKFPRTNSKGQNESCTARIKK